MPLDNDTKMETETFRYGLRVCYVYGAQKKHEILPMVRKFCDDQYLIMTARQYDPDHYSEDASVITSLPAFHVYYEDGWDDTFYPEDNYIGIMRKHLKQAREEHMKKQSLSRWKRFLKNLVPSRRREKKPIMPRTLSAPPLEFPAEHQTPYEAHTALRTPPTNPSL